MSLLHVTPAVSRVTGYKDAAEKAAATATASTPDHHHETIQEIEVDVIRPHTKHLFVLKHES